jgi:hypothetical protein
MQFPMATVKKMHCMKVYRRPEERFAQCNVVGTVSFGGGSVMIWGSISLDTRTEMFVVAMDT